jgi:hypothetical protein
VNPKLEPVYTLGPDFAGPGARDTRHMEYFTGEPPKHECPKKKEGIETVEDCLVAYREAHLFPFSKKRHKPICHNCTEGARVRAEFAEAD